MAQGQGKDPADGLTEVYAGFVQRDRILVMDSRSAELSKYAANAFLATKLSFINEMAGLSEAMGADIELVRRVIGMDARIGPGYLASGIGYGGSCLPKDVSSLLHLAGQNETPMNVLAGVQEANALQPRRLFERLACHFPGGLMGVRVAVWGLAFKPGTDDIREAPALTIVQMLARAGASAVAFDPVASGRAKTVLNGQTAYAVDAYACLQGADALVIATEWEHFREPDWARMREAMRGRAIFDGRNMYDPSAVSAQGFTYCSIGRRTAVPETAGVSTQV